MDHPYRQRRRAGDAEPQVQQELDEPGHVLLGQDLVDRGDGHEQRDPVEDQALYHPRERPDRRKDRDRRADQQRQNHADRVGEGMEQRQEHDQPVLVRSRESPRWRPGHWR